MKKKIIFIIGSRFYKRKNLQELVDKYTYENYYSNIILKIQ